MINRSWARLFVMLAYVMGLYVSLPFTRSVVTDLRAMNLLRVSIGAGASLLCLGLFYVLIKRESLQRRSALAWIAAICIVFTGLFFTTPLPEEGVHFIQYGLLPSLAIFSLSPFLEGRKLYAVAFSLSLLFGVGDEVIQGLLPERHFELRDIGLNFVGASVGFLFYLGIRHWP